MTNSSMGIFDKLIAAGYESAKLDQANKQAEMMQSSACLTVVQYKNLLLDYAAKVVIGAYRSDKVIQIFGSFLFNKAITMGTAMSELASHKVKYGVSDLNIKDLDKRADLLADCFNRHIDAKVWHPHLVTITGSENSEWLHIEPVLAAVLKRIEQAGGSVPDSLIDQVRRQQNGY